MDELIESLQGTCSDVKAMYSMKSCVEYKQNQTCGADLIHALSEFLIRKAERQLTGHTADSRLNIVHYQGHCLIDQNVALPTLASTQSREMRQWLKLLQPKKLWQCWRKKKGKQQNLEAENLARQQEKQNKWRKLECLEEVQKLNAARPHVKVSDQV